MRFKSFDLGRVNANHHPTTNLRSGLPKGTLRIDMTSCAEQGMRGKSTTYTEILPSTPPSLVLAPESAAIAILMPAKSFPSFVSQ